MNVFSPRLMTIERFILERQQEFPAATGRFTNLLYDIALAAKLISRETTRAGIANILGALKQQNVHGETQQKLDVFADQVIYRIHDQTGRVCVMASEEHDDLLHLPGQCETGYYVLTYDPLDGSSNIDFNASIGTIFGIFRKVTEGDGPGTMEDVLQPGHRLIAAVYVIYGSSTMLVYSAGHGVHGFTLDPSVGEFLLSHPDIRIPDQGKYYSVNQGYQRYWTPGVQRYVEYLQAINHPDRKPLGHRYIGSMVGDFHRTLLSGGVFLYPADTQKPEGKLRLTYEAAPLAFIAAQAGGYASDGLGDILDLQPRDLHQRVPFYAGNRGLVELAERYQAEHDAEWLAQYRQQRRVAPLPQHT